MTTLAFPFEAQAASAAAPLRLPETNWNGAVVRALYDVMEEHGHVLYEGGHVIPPGDDSTLYAAAGIQHWRRWVLEAVPDGDRGRVGPQWCVRMNSVERVGRTNFLTSFCMLSCLTRGALEREQALERMFEVFVNRWGLPFDDLAFVATGGGPLAPEDTASLKALERLGVRQSNYAARPRKWACPFKPYGPAGPELFVLLDKSGTPCGSDCSPMCGCGRYFHFWNLEFLENRSLPSGGTERLAMPFLDSAGSIEWVIGAATRTFDLYEALPFRPLLRGWREAADAGARTLSDERLRILTDHTRTIALLTGVGVEPSAKRHGHVLRRLIRRSFAILTAAGADLGLLSRNVERTRELYAHLEGFPAEGAGQASALAREAERYREQVKGWRKAYERLTARPVEASAEKVYQLHAEHGLSWELLEQWLEADGVSLDRERLAALRDADRERSRGR
jgi:alanyl-tRNA synthetase